MGRPSVCVSVCPSGSQSVSLSVCLSVRVCAFVYAQSGISGWRLYSTFWIEYRLDILCCQGRRRILGFSVGVSGLWHLQALDTHEKR